MNIPEQDILDIVNSLDNNAFEDKRILITGNAGYLGQIFTAYFKYLQENILIKPCKLVLVDNYLISEPIKDKLNDDILLLDCDINKELKIEGPIDYVLNCAGMAQPKTYMKYPKICMDIGYIGTRNILELAKEKKCQNVLIFSSSEVYGNPEAWNIPTPETYNGNVPTLADRSNYDYSKKNCEVWSYIYHKYDNVKSTIVRPFNSYALNPLTDTRVLPSFINKILKNEPILIYGDGSQTRTYTYVSDFIIGAIKVLLKGKSAEAYNIGSDKPEISLNNLAHKVKTVLNLDIEIKHIPYPSNYPQTEPMRRCPDITKAREELKFEPKISLEDGIKRFYNWAKVTYKY